MVVDYQPGGRSIERYLFLVNWLLQVHDLLILLEAKETPPTHHPRRTQHLGVILGGTQPRTVRSSRTLVRD